ncbi:MAG: hypothetical protein O7G86_13635 [Gammaproteobacteria bacterium]|nr:hypothetical protein [Gammaproteobacteria bacterium]
MPAMCPERSLNATDSSSQGIAPGVSNTRQVEVDGGEQARGFAPGIHAGALHKSISACDPEQSFKICRVLTA